MIACHVDEYTKLRGEPPILDGGKDGKAAKILLQKTGSAAAATAVIRRAYAESDFVKKHPDLMFIAQNLNDWRGAAPVKTTGARHAVQPVPVGGSAWQVGT